MSLEHGAAPDWFFSRPHGLGVLIHQRERESERARETTLDCLGEHASCIRHTPPVQSHTLSRRRLPTPDPTMPQSPIILVQISSPLLFFTLAPPVTVNCRRIHALFSFQLLLHSDLGFFDLSGQGPRTPLGKHREFCASLVFLLAFFWALFWNSTTKKTSLRFTVRSTRSSSFSPSTGSASGSTACYQAWLFWA